jgi:CheY-like chemotaxis protein
VDENEGTHTVLVAYVDDSWGGRELARRVLEKHGHLSLLGADGSDAVSLRFGDPEPDAMFINGQMTYMPGPKAIEIIREREAVEGRRRMPIALETAWARPPK